MKKVKLNEEVCDLKKNHSYLKILLHYVAF